MVSQKQAHSIFPIVNLIEACLGTLFNISGLYLLFITKKSSRQDLVLIHLSLLEGLMALCSIAYLSLILECGFDSKKPIIVNVEIILEGLCVAGKLCMVNLAFDRLAGTLFPCAYRTHFSRLKFHILLLGPWAIGIGSTTVIVLTEDAKTRSIFHLSTAVVSIFLLVSSYCIIVYKMKNNLFSCQRETFRRSTNQRSSTRFGENHATFVCFVVLSVYVLFSLLPDIGWTLQKLKILNAHIIPHVCFMLWLLNFSLDPLIYIYMKPEIRAELHRRGCRKVQRNLSIRLSSLKNGLPQEKREPLQDDGR